MRGRDDAGPRAGRAAGRSTPMQPDAVAAPTSDCATFTRAGVLDGTGASGAEQRRGTADSPGRGRTAAPCPVSTVVGVDEAARRARGCAPATGTRARRASAAGRPSRAARTRAAGRARRPRRGDQPPRAGVVDGHDAAIAGLRTAAPRSARTPARRETRRPRTGSAAPSRWGCASARRRSRRRSRTPSAKGRSADRQEDPQRAEDRHDLQDDQEELRAVARETDLRAADPRPRVGRLEGHVVAGLDERQRRRRRRREAVRQQVQELAQVRAARRRGSPTSDPESRGRSGSSRAG